MDQAEREEILRLAEEFAREGIRPGAEQRDADAAMGDEVLHELAEVGFLGMTVPEAYGGLELDLRTVGGVLRALAWGDPSVALTVGIHNGPVVAALLSRGTDEQKERWLPALASGESLGAFALSEPAAGSDAGSLRVEGRSGPGGWALHGTKRWVTNGGRAGLVVTFARAGEEEGGAGVGAFLVDPQREGYRVTGRERTMGLRASETAAVELEGAEVPESDVLAAPGEGFECARDALVVGRVGLAFQAVGLGESARDHSIRYALERKQFGRPLTALGAIQEKLARMATDVAAARTLSERAADAVDEAGGLGRVRHGGGAEQPDALAAMAKISASEAAVRAADEAVQIFGGYGYMRDYPVEKLLRDAKAMEILEGTNEVLRYVVARRMTGDDA